MNAGEKSKTLSDEEFAEILAAPKWIDDDIQWEIDTRQRAARSFRMDIRSEQDWPLFIQGRYSRHVSKLTYALILWGIGRIFALDMGMPHHNPQCHTVGDKHMHKWSEKFGDKEAYVPDDIVGSAQNPEGIWVQFCRVARIEHQGRMLYPLP